MSDPTATRPPESGQTHIFDPAAQASPAPEAYQGGQTVLWTPRQTSQAPATRPASQRGSAPSAAKKPSLWVWGAGSMVSTVVIVVFLGMMDPGGPFGSLLGMSISPEAKAAFNELASQTQKAIESKDPRALEQFVQKFDDLGKSRSHEPARFLDAVGGAESRLKQAHLELASAWWETAQAMADKGQDLDKAQDLLTKVMRMRALTAAVERVQVRAAKLLNDVGSKGEASLPGRARQLASEGKYAEALGVYNAWLASANDMDGMRERERIRRYLDVAARWSAMERGPSVRATLMAMLELLANFEAPGPDQAYLQRLYDDTNVLAGKLDARMSPKELRDAFALLHAGQPAQALQAFEELMLAPPKEFGEADSATARFGLAQALFATGKRPEALRELNQVIQAQPGMAEVYLWKGHCLTLAAADLTDAQDGAVQEALSAYETAAKLLPDDVRPLARLAQLQLALGNVGKANELRRRAQDLARLQPTPVNLHEISQMEPLPGPGS